MNSQKQNNTKKAKRYLKNYYRQYRLLKEKYRLSTKEWHSASSLAMTMSEDHRMISSKW